MTKTAPDPRYLTEEPRTLTVSDVAADLRVSVPVVRRLMREGSLPAFRVGRSWRIEPGEYAAWKVERRRQAARLARMGA